jgi:hypothetical protein
LTRLLGGTATSSVIAVDILRLRVAPEGGASPDRRAATESRDDSVERRRSVAAVAVRSSVMPYLASIALDDWTGRRRDERRVLEEAHRVVSQVTPGSGRPRQRGGDHLAQAFILRIYSEFQAFVRELHDVTASVLMRGLDVPQSSHPPLIAAATLGRGIDRGNAGLRTISDDFKRLGYGTMLADLGVFNSRQGRDQQRYETLTRLRNALAHGNSDQLEILRRDRVKPTLTYGRGSLPALNRIARAMDRAVWDHATSRFPALSP